VGEEEALIDVAGVGYVVRCGSRTLSRLPGTGETATLHIESHWGEQTGMTLYGFLDKTERRAFVMLKTIQGVGPKLALRIVTELKDKPIGDGLVAAFHAAASPATPAKPSATGEAVGPEFLLRPQKPRSRRDNGPTNPPPSTSTAPPPPASNPESTPATTEPVSNEPVMTRDGFKINKDGIILGEVFPQPESRIAGAAAVSTLPHCKNPPEPNCAGGLLWQGASTAQILNYQKKYNTTGCSYIKPPRCYTGQKRTCLEQCTP